MISFPNCKINLGLNIIRKREDGFHDLETVFYPVNLYDALEIITNNEEQTNKTGKATQKNTISISGLEIEGNAEDNICNKACQLLQQNFPQVPSVKMHLHKAIPMGAGLGGGSADAAFTLLLLNKKFSLNLTVEQILDYALLLGSDCPFFVVNKPCFAQGRGELLQKINLDLGLYNFLVVNPGIHISTRWAFTKITPTLPSIGVKEIVQQPIHTWKEYLFNDFEKPVLQYYPQLKSLKENLYNLGALYAAMTGSGSTFFGIFPAQMKVDKSVFPNEYFVKEVLS